MGDTSVAHSPELTGSELPLVLFEYCLYCFVTSVFVALFKRS